MFGHFKWLKCHKISLDLIADAVVCYLEYARMIFKFKLRANYIRDLEISKQVSKRHCKSLYAAGGNCSAAVKTILFHFFLPMRDVFPPGKPL